jgi:hypothetical protein
MECDIKPRDFVASRNTERFKTSGFFASETGETCYVGARGGERMARVYRYVAPHPRSHLLRAETEYKGQAARKLAEHLLSVSLIEVTLAAHLPFGWSHPIWDTGDMVISKIPARAYDKSHDCRWKWISEVCWPAIQKAHHDGIIDLDEMCKVWLGKA